MVKKHRIKVVFDAIIDKYRKNVKNAIDSTLKLGESGKKASKDVNFDKSIDSAERLDNSLKQVGNTLKRLVVGYAGKKIFDAGIANIENFVEYEDGVTSLNIMLKDLSKDAKEAVVDDLKEISYNLRQMPNEVISSAYDALSKSVPVDNLNEFMETAIKTGIGGSTTTPVAVGALTSVVNAYGQEVLSYTEASDLMFTTMEKGDTTISELASSLYHVLPTATMLEIPFDNVTASLATLTATSYPAAQAASAIGSLFEEFSNNRSRVSQTLNHITGKSFKELIKEGYNLQDVLIILKKYADELGVEINNLFNKETAGNAASTLLKNKFTSDLQAMQDAAGATERAFEEKANGLKYSIDGIKSKWELFKVSIGETYREGLHNSLEDLNASLDRANNNGSLDRLAQSIGDLMASAIGVVDRLVNNIDRVIHYVGRMTNFINNILPYAARVVSLFFKAWVSYKIVSFATSAIKTFTKAAKILAGVLPAVSKAIGGLFKLLSSNPIALVIGAVIALIGWLVKLKLESEGYHNWLLAAFEMVKVGFKLVLLIITEGIYLILRDIANLTRKIPLIGWAFENMARVAGSALQAVDNSINGSIERLHALQTQAAQGVHINYSYSMTPRELLSSGKLNALTKHSPELEKIKAEVAHKVTPIGPDMRPLTPPPKAPDMSDFNFTPAPPKVSSGGGGGGSGTSSKPKKKTIQDRIREISEKHDPDKDLYESRARLAEAKGDDKAAEKHKRSLIESIRREVDDLLKLEESTSGKNKKIVEAARNNLLIRIEEILEDINDTLGELVGDFNVPSDLKKMTEYQYKVRNATNTLTKRLIFSPDIKMYLTIDDTGEKGVTQIQQELRNFGNAIFEDKNGLVSNFINDVTRN